MKKKMCHITIPHDFKDYPCKICSPKEYKKWIKNKPKMNPTTEWVDKEIEPLEQKIIEEFGKKFYVEPIKKELIDLLLQHRKEVIEESIKLIKEKGLHLGYKNDIINLLQTLIK